MTFFYSKKTDTESNIPHILDALDHYKREIKAVFTHADPIADNESYQKIYQQYKFFLQLESFARALARHSKGREILEDTYQSGVGFEEYVKNLPQALVPNLSEIRQFGRYEQGALGVAATGFVITLTPGLEVFLLCLLACPVVDVAGVIVGLSFMAVGLALMVAALSQMSLAGFAINGSLEKITQAMDARYDSDIDDYVLGLGLDKLEGALGKVVEPASTQNSQYSVVAL